MNTKSFFGKIREIIREEIDYALTKKLNEHSLKNIVETKSSEKPKKSIKNNNSDQFSSIQDLLNETKRSLQESMEYDDGEINFTSDMAHGFASRKANSVIPNGYSEENVPDDVMRALTKNYSALIKKIDEKKGR